MMKNIVELKELTNQLRDKLMISLERYENVRQTKKVYDFFESVKPFGDEVHHLTSLWKEHVLQWIKQKRPKNVYPVQIENAVEQINELVIKAFYPDTSYKRFKSTYQSVLYTVELVIQQLEGYNE